MADKDWLSISEISEVTGRDRVTVRNRLAGIEPKIGPKNAKLYNRNAALPLVLGNGAPQGEDEAKQRKAAAEAEKAEIIVAKLKGELVSVADMKTAAAQLIKTLYTRTVRVEPQIIATKCVGKTALEIEIAVRESLAAVFNELKTMPETFLSVPTTESDEEGEDDDN
jgi:hypothetical protein